MRNPPHNPHFFKPLNPDYTSGVKIPNSFLRYLNGEKLEQCILRRGGGEWTVTITNQSLANGWANFASDNGLVVGDVLVFRHEGEMQFEILVFDQTGCEKDYPWEDEQQVHTRGAEEFLVEKSSEAFNMPRKSLRGKCGNNVEEPSSNATDSNRPFFVSILKPHNIRKSTLTLPITFVRSNLSRGHRKMILRDQEQRSWPAEFKDYGVYAYIGGGLKEFFVANGLKGGEALKFELIRNGRKPIVAIHC